MTNVSRLNTILMYAMCNVSVDNETVFFKYPQVHTAGYFINMS